MTVTRKLNDNKIRKDVLQLAPEERIRLTRELNELREKEDNQNDIETKNNNPDQLEFTL
jgi:hypothetical protein